ncbi:MAG: hypothetical protein KME21_29705 [Desmonostoc vinosum HA7617-LM4]|jgi:hypothetical protein|nr:hypothetical protein [Desmonostoc vinosum HA7617-LM4]
MTLVKQNSLNTPAKPPKTLVEKQIETERMRDVLVLLQNLINSEEATVKLILDCLYDIGSVNVINQKFRWRYPNRIMKLIARMSKPAFKALAIAWFKKNCPQLITDWLYSKVTFDIPQKTPQEMAVEVAQPQLSYSPSKDNVDREIKNLRNQVRLLAGILIVAIASLGVTVTLLSNS